MSGESPNNWLFRLYRRYLGEPETETDVYLGFGLFFAGIIAAAFALVLFSIGAGVYGLRTTAYFALAQPGYVLGMLAMPVSLLGVVVLLPTKRRVLGVAAAGLLTTGLAATVFLTVYPAEWFEFGTRNTLAVVGTYAVGVGAMLAATGASLVGQQLERAGAPVPSDIRPAEDPAEETLSDEDVRADIEEAMASVELTWGGVEKPEGKRLNLNTDFADGMGEEVDVAAKRTVAAGGVDSQVSGLKKLKGGERSVNTSASTVDDQTAALNALKDQKRKDEVPENAPLREWGPIARIRRGLRLS